MSVVVGISLCLALSEIVSVSVYTVALKQSTSKWEGTGSSEWSFFTSCVPLQGCHCGETVGPAPSSVPQSISGPPPELSNLNKVPASGSSHPRSQCHSRCWRQAVLRAVTEPLVAPREVFYSILSCQGGIYFSVDTSLTPAPYLSNWGSLRLFWGPQEKRKHPVGQNNWEQLLFLPVESFACSIGKIPNLA